MSYADLILPLPLQGTFTYAIPVSMQSGAQVGVRVLVPFGRNKTYLGIVARLHDEKPQGYEVKEISQVMDAEPIVTPSSCGYGSGLPTITCHPSVMSIRQRCLPV